MNEELINKVKVATVDLLTKMTRSALEDAAVTLSGVGGGKSNKTDLYIRRDEICQQFSRMLEYEFHKLLGNQDFNPRVDKGYALTLEDKSNLESANAMEGMVSFSRNINIREYLSFTIRFDSLYDLIELNESNNPLDPNQIGQALMNAIRPLKFDERYSLIIYRNFNRVVLRNLAKVLEAGNKIMLDAGIMPDLVVDARSKKAQLGKRSFNRPNTSADERAFADATAADQLINKGSTSEMFVVIQNLMHGFGPKDKKIDHPAWEKKAQEGVAKECVVPTLAMSGEDYGGSLYIDQGLMSVNVEADMMLGDSNLEIISEKDLLTILVNIQRHLETAEDGSTITDLIGQALYNMSEGGVVKAIDASSYEIISIITRIYDALSHDISLVRPIKDLVGSTQVTAIKVALTDPEFFTSEQHSFRALLNEVANAGIGWTNLEKLRNDTTFVKIKQLIERLVTEFDGSPGLLDDLLEEFHQFKSSKQDNTLEARQRIMDSEERKQRISEIHDYVTQKIQERLHEKIPSVVSQILKNHFHQFLVNLVVKEGLGSNSWTHVIKTIDLLLWSVRADKAEGDRARYDDLNPNLLSILGKIFKITGLDTQQGDKLTEQLKEAQLKTFGWDDEEAIDEAGVPGNVVAINSNIAIDFGDQQDTAIIKTKEKPKAGISPSDSDEYLLQVNRLPAGIWVEFIVDDTRSIHCTLAARLDSIDKLIFVNQHGVKVVEKTRMGLVRELRDGTVKIISEWPLFERAMESVIGSLRYSLSG